MMLRGVCAQWVRGLFGGLALGVSTASAETLSLSLSKERSSPFDLEITAGLRDVPSGESRFVTWAELATLPSAVLDMDGEFVPGSQKVTVVQIAELQKALPLAESADTLLAWCTDGYFSIYEPIFLAEQHPLMVLAINGAGPETWPPEGLSFNPGPYVITVSEAVAPGVSKILDVNHKRPWGVDRIAFVNRAETLVPATTGPWATLSERAIRGREIWVNSCTSCHVGPQGLVSGTKSDRPFEVIAAHAAYNADYFRRYVRDPTSVVASAKMQAHPDYSDADLDALIAFIVAEKP